MPRTGSSASTPVPRRPPPPPPVPTAAPEPSPEIAPEQEQTQAATHAEPPSKYRHRGLMRVIGGFFKRKCSDADDVTAPSDSEASQRRTSRWSRWSHRQSLPDAPLEVTAVTEPATAPIQEIDSTSSSTHMEEPVAKKSKKEKLKNETKPKLSFVKAKQSPSDPSERMGAESSDESGEEPSRISFLFFGGSDADSTFQPDLRPSELDDLHENEIRPSLQAKMPLFLSPLLVENMRRSSILPDPKEYEF